MDTEYRALLQGSSSSWCTADASSWGAAQQQKRQRCQGSSSDQVGSSSSSSLKISEPEPQQIQEDEEEEDYYMEEDCDDDDDGYDEDDYDFDEADFNQHLADKFDDLDLPPGVEATVPWLQKIAPKEEAKEGRSQGADKSSANPPRKPSLLIDRTPTPSKAIARRLTFRAARHPPPATDDMDTEYRALQQGSSSSWCTADASSWGAAQQQKRQRCQGSSSDQVGSSSCSSLKISEPEPQQIQEEEEDYYMEEDCDDDDDGYDKDDYDFDEADFNQHLADKFDDLDLPPGVEATVPWLQKIAPKEEAKEPPKSNTADENANKFTQFKQFDTVQNFSDHHYAKNSHGEPNRTWSKRVQHDWKLLEKDLPAYIYVRVAEDRMDLLRAAIIGPKGTPYHDGLFFFDVHMPPTYPSGPPVVYYHSGGLLINPNLYENGKVCLSLLGTWSGRGCENWNPAQSTMLQVLVSIQALILNDKPYYNEPGYESYANDPQGQRSALDYNDKTFLYSCRTMLYSLRRPPEHFADLVAGHFRVHGHIILAACKHYMAGNDIGSVVPEDEEESEYKSGDAGASSSSSSAPKPKPGVIKAIPPNRRSSCSFNPSLKVLYEDLLMEFNVKGADTRKFIVEKLKKNQPAAT